MKHYKYLIAGGGQAGDAAVRGIRGLDTEGSIGMICSEIDPPYSRPTLSKRLWQGLPIEKIWRNTEKLGSDLHLDCTVTKINPENKTVLDDKGKEYSYDKLLLATGGSPIRLPFGEDEIIYYHDLQDYKQLRALSERGENFLVIGGGFIGSEIAAALTMAGKNVTMVFPENDIGANVYPAQLSKFISEYFRKKGVEVISGDTIVSLEKTGEKISVHTKGGTIFEADGVVAGIGIRPNIELAKEAGLSIGNGIIVDEHLKTSVSDIYAAGDVASFYHSALGKRIRLEHENNAVTMGRMAGKNMAGANESYTYIPMFYSDLFDLRYEAVGELNSTLETVVDWKEPFKKGVIYYLKEERVRGILLWNMKNLLSDARSLLEELGPFKASDLIDRL
ncbi:MAG TPA: NAD(P)/FAD-dependent oxidoreductase [Treponema sp.]|nr:NAD(P)/FAD-dependent oxidoreductase [Treponema sp.]